MRLPLDNRGDTILCPRIRVPQPGAQRRLLLRAFPQACPRASLDHHTQGETPYTLHAPVSPCGSPERNQTPLYFWRYPPPPCDPAPLEVRQVVVPGRKPRVPDLEIRRLQLDVLEPIP